MLLALPEGKSTQHMGIGYTTAAIAFEPKAHYHPGGGAHHAILNHTIPTRTPARSHKRQCASSDNIPL